MDLYNHIADMFFERVQHGPPDVMYHLKIKADEDIHPQKVDLGVGVYRNEAGVYHELKAVKEAKDHLNATNPTHDYEVTTGNAEYLRHAAKVVFGEDSDALRSRKVASVQTISGTGVVHIALLFLKRAVPELNKTVYLGTPTWGNYQPMCELVGLEVETYKYYSPEAGGVDWESVLNAVRGAPRGSIFALQGCCHNPTAADFTKSQWVTLAEEMKARQLFPLFDIAYHGLGNGLEEDIFCVRHFAQMSIDMLVCQSFSKNFGLYGERVGALHAVCSDSTVAAAVHDQLRFLLRSEFSSAPAYGARITFRETPNPRKSIPRAVKQTFWRIACFYIIGILVLGMAVPYDSEQLIGATKQRTSADIYCASWSLYGLAKDSQAPKLFAKTLKSGNPIWAVAISASFALLAFMNASKLPSNVFQYFVNLVTIFAVLDWTAISVSHISFRKALKAQNIELKDLPYVGLFQPYGSYHFLLISCLVIFFSGYDAFIPHFKPDTFILKYLGTILFLLNVVFWKIFKKTKRIKATEVDLITGRRQFEEMESTGDEQWKESWWKAAVGKLKHRK
ncbi:Aspartate aminotransferase [Paramyrothecium foliicola]|nr:Aspartate aminotransferase [Paramyrothecium foliicola]